MGLVRLEKFKTFFSILVTLVVLTGLVLTTSVAAPATTTSTTAQLAVESVNGTPGDVVQIPVTLTSSGDVAGIEFNFSYDATQLTYQSTSAGSLASSGFTVNGHKTADGMVKIMIYYSGTPVAGSSGTIAKLQFEVNTEVQAGATSILGLSDVMLIDDDTNDIATTTTDGQFSVNGMDETGVSKEPGGDIGNAVFYIAVQDSAGGEVNYYYFTRTELEAYETQEAYYYNDHSVMKTVTCKGALLKDLLNDLKGVDITDDMIVQYAEQDAYHADPASAVIDSSYKDTVESLLKHTVGGDGSTKNPMRSIITYLIHEEYDEPDAYNVNDPAGEFKDADNNSGYLRVYRDTGNANSTVIKYLMGVVVSTSGSLLTQDHGITVSCVSAKNPTIKIIDDSQVQGVLPGMGFAVKAPVVTNAILAADQAESELITVGSGDPVEQVITFKYDEDTYFYVKNNTTGTETDYTYTDLVAMHIQTPDAAANTPPYGYSRPMYYRYDGIWLSELLNGVSGDYTVKLLAKDGSKTDITNDVSLYFAAYNNTQSKSSTNIPEGKRVTITYNDAKIIIPGTGENITGSSDTDYTTAGKDVDVLMAAAEGLEISLVSSDGEVTGIYTIMPQTDTAYQNGSTANGIKTMTVNTGVSGMTYFAVRVAPVREHNGSEAVVFVHIRNGVQLNINVTKADFDVVNTAQAGFNAKSGDVIKAYIVDDLRNDVNFNPTILQASSVS